MRSAVVFGSTGGIGAALTSELSRMGGFDTVLGLSRHSVPAFDLVDEPSIRDAARHIAPLKPALVVVATGMLRGKGIEPEKTIRAIDPARMAGVFAINAIGPAAVMKHVLPAMQRDERSVFAVLSAKVGSIGDNRLGGWASYRASKAALNQLVRTAAIELRRTHPKAICVAIHPGTVATALSSGFAATGLEIQQPAEAARDILKCLNALQSDQSGGFFDRFGQPIPF
ncbi:SDR family NAD(P)-dependent oxidoreductase [Cereibacter sp. SYSU M97828]|nr:SDR family NAD(P)-dependent oxidoreductase [Cereibacter flavus]